MPIVSLKTVILLMKIAFLVGAITDGLAIIPMLSRRVGAALFSGDSSGKDTASYRYAMGIAASLMAGWTILLLWGSINPIERRDILILTVFPVIIGIVLATIIAARQNIVRPSRVIPLWIHLGIVSLFYILVYILSTPYT